MSRFQPSPTITHELLEGEVVAINFETGVYYSLRGSAATIWQSLMESSTDLDHICELFSNGEATSRDEISQFLLALRDEGLIVEEEAPSLPLEADSSSEKIPYAKPAFEKFNDMSELLLADPIHEVDATGWPNVSS